MKNKPVIPWVKNMKSSRGNSIPNQFIIYTSRGVFFQSYQSIIAFFPCDEDKVYLNKDKWDYSKTTGKYRNLFLNETKKETEAKILSGEYVLVGWL